MARPARRGTIDRRLGGLAVLVSALLVAAVAAAAGPEGFSRVPDGLDADTLADLALLIDRGAFGEWAADFSVTRETAAGRRSTTVREIHRPPVHAIVESDSLTLHVDGRTITCVDVDDSSQCLEAEASDTAAPTPGAIMVGAVALGHYSVAEIAGRTLAGDETRCFRVEQVAGDVVGALGESYEACYTADGIPLHTRVRRAGVTDERTATAVSRRVSSAEIDAVLDAFDPSLARALE